MIPTPSTSHVQYDHIYEPAEDSFLLLDAISYSSETEFLQNRFSVNSSPAPLILEVGVGSGVVLAFATANAEKIFGRSDVLSMGTDVNELACDASRKTVNVAVQDAKTASLSGMGAEQPLLLGTVNADLATCVREGEVDVLIFNPPYVPTDEVPDGNITTQLNTINPDTFDKNSHLLALSYAGGSDGMEVTNKLLASLPNILHPRRGIAYILFCAQNKPENISKTVQEWGPSWSAKTVGSSGKTAGWEKLQVLRIWRT